MPLFHITIEKVIVKNDEKIEKMLQQILDKLDVVNEDPDGELKQKMLDKLNAIISDIKSTV